MYITDIETDLQTGQVYKEKANFFRNNDIADIDLGTKQYNYAKGVRVIGFLKGVVQLFGISNFGNYETLGTMAFQSNTNVKMQ